MDTPSAGWAARLRALVFEQFKLSNWAIPTANAIADGRAKLANVFAAMLLLWSIDSVTDDSSSPLYGVGRGVQLDRIGKLVGQRRGAAADSEYRPILRARIVANKSTGGPEQAIAVFLAMFAGSGAPLIVPGWIAEYTLRLVGVLLDPLLVPAALGLLASSTQGGTRAVLEWSTVDSSELLIAGALGSGQAMGDPMSSITTGMMTGAAAAT